MIWPRAELPLASSAEPKASDAYDRLAESYDGLEHETTRVLEALSRRALERLGREHALNSHAAHIVEVGAGTGALTSALVEMWPDAHVCATDPSARMLAVLKDKLALQSRLLATEIARATTALARSEAPPDLVVAGLADPYLDLEALLALRAGFGSLTRLFVTVPSGRWAHRERSQRLGVPIDTTRFRLRDGNVVFARSLAYEQADLQLLLTEADFVPVRMGVESSQAMWSRPEISWALAAPRSPIGP